MLITCPHCETSYEIAVAKLGDEGRSVRCARCQSQWLAKAPVFELEHQSWSVGQSVGARGVVDHDPFPPLPSLDAGSAPTLHNPAPPAADPPEAPPSDVVIAPPLAPVLDDAPNEIAPSTDAEPVDIESLAARRSRLVHPPAPARRRRMLRPGLLAMALAAIIAALVGGRAQVVRLLPQAAPLFSAIGLPVNLRGLAFEDLSVSGESDDNVPVLVVSGIIRNITAHPVAVPRLRFALRSPAGLEVYAWTTLPSTATLGPYLTQPFRSRLASPPSDTKDVVVRFFTRQDIEAGH